MSEAPPEAPAGREASDGAAGLPPRAEDLYVLESLSRYWQGREQVIARLPVRSTPGIPTDLRVPSLRAIELPGWAADCGVQGRLLVPTAALTPGEGPEWSRVGWLAAAFWYLTGSAERQVEEARGPIHSYSFRLAGWDPGMWERAWVNRVALFLRRWASHTAGVAEDTLFGPLPAHEIRVTHDLDAVRKTSVIRVKQGAFRLFNAARHVRAGEWRSAGSSASRAARFMASTGDFDRLDEVVRLEERYGIRGQINVYGGTGGWKRSPKQILFDPSYSLPGSDLPERLREISGRGWTIGLHQSFDSWADPERMAAERLTVERALGVPVRSGRQHWLRFGWADTWKAQEAAGLEEDTTLGFNDRPGFRNGAALRFRPWDAQRARAREIQAVPLVLMDSHFYDYAPCSDTERLAQLTRWVAEVKEVRGVATVLWHPHVLSDDYGWRDGFVQLLELVGAE